MNQNIKKIKELLKETPKVKMDNVRRAILREKILREIRKNGKEHFFEKIKDIFLPKRLAPILTSTLVIIITFFVFAFNQKNEAVATFYSVEGNVFIQSQNGEITKAFEEAILKIGDRVLVNKDSKAQIRFLDKSISTLDENTEIEIESAMKDVEKGEKKLVAINLKKGNIKTIKNDENSEFSIKTPNEEVITSGNKKSFEVSVVDDTEIQNEEDVSEDREVNNENEEDIETENTEPDNENTNEEDQIESEKNNIQVKVAKEKKIDFNDLRLKAKIARVKLEQSIEKLLLENDLAGSEKSLKGYLERKKTIAEILGIKEEDPDINDILGALEKKSIQNPEEVESVKKIISSLIRIENAAKEINSKKKHFATEYSKGYSSVPEINTSQKIIKKEDFLSDDSKLAISFLYEKQASSLTPKEIFQKVETEKRNLLALEKLSRVASPRNRLALNKKILEIREKIREELENQED